jgi:PAS domain S-box-containing protein
MSIITRTKHQVSKSAFELTGGAVVLFIVAAFLSQFGYDFILNQCDKAKLGRELAEKQQAWLRQIQQSDRQVTESEKGTSAQQLRLFVTFEKSLGELKALYGDKESLWLENSGEHSTKDLVQQIQLDWQELSAIVSAEEADASRLYRHNAVLNKHYLQLLTQYDNYLAKLQTVIGYFSFATLFLQTGLGAFVLWVLYAFLYQPLLKTGTVAARLSRGDLPESCGLSTAGTIGTLAHSLDEMIRNQSAVSAFAEEIGNSNYDGKYEFGEQNQIGATLLKMRDQLKSASLADMRRSWANEGYNLFTDLLREKHEGIQQMGSALLAKLVNYLNMNQGALFLLQTEEEEEEEYLELLAAYAWERKKFLNKKIAVQEGVVGQAVLDAETLYITDVPPDFVNITSGLGKANPSCVLVVPLKYNEQVLGVLELASLHRVEKYQIEFIEKLAESLASSLATIQNTKNTEKLLEDSQQITNQLKRKEEELRNNSVELEAAREDLSRKLGEATQEMELRIKEIEGERKKNIAILEGCVDGVITFNQEGEIEFFNKAAEEIWEVDRSQMVGRPVKEIIPIEFTKEGGRFKAHYIWEGQMKPIDVRTELMIKNQFGEEVSVLLTLSDACAGEAAYFALFIQRISVELF